MCTGDTLDLYVVVVCPAVTVDKSDINSAGAFAFGYETYLQHFMLFFLLY